MLEEFRLTKKQAEYIREGNHRWNVSCGAVRSGKSYLQVSYLIPKRMMERKDKRGLIVLMGATRSNIERNLLQPIRDIYGDTAATDISAKNYTKIFGIKAYCVGADNVRQVAKIRGSEISYCAVDEVTDLNEEVFAMLKSRLSLPWSCCDITTNPGRPTHWFKRFLDSKDQGVDIFLQEYTIYDNPFLPIDYVRNLEAEYRGTVWYDRYILGRWTLAEGLVFPRFSECLEDTFLGPHEEYAISVDYGTSNPFAAILWARNGPTWHAIREYYYSGRETGVQKTDGEYLDDLKEFAQPAIEAINRKNAAQRDRWGFYTPEVERIPVIIDPSAASFVALLRQSEIFRPKSANNDVLNGIRDTSSAMHNGIIKVSRDCDHWLQEAQSYIWDPNGGEDRPIKENDHLMDATRYFVKTMRLVRPIDTWSLPPRVRGN